MIKYIFIILCFIYCLLNKFITNYFHLFVKRKCFKLYNTKNDLLLFTFHHQINQQFLLRFSLYGKPFHDFHDFHLIIFALLLVIL